MRNYQWVDDALEQGYYPILSLRCYQVSYTEGTRRTLTRYSAGDISSQYIDMDSIHAEWAYSPSDIFEPGGCIPVSLSFKLLPGSGLSLETVINPTSAADYSYVYYPIVTFKHYKINTSYFATPFPYMILREQTKVKGDIQAKRLYFEDETCMFDYVDIDVASYSGQLFSQLIWHLLNTCGLADSQNSGIVGGVSLVGTNYYDGEPMSGRQLLSYIGETNGVFFIMNSNSMLKIAEMLDAEKDGDTYVHDMDLSWQYYVSHSTGEIWPSTYPWRRVLVFAYGAERRTGNFPDTYILYDNPFVNENNTLTYYNLLRERLIKTLQYSCTEVEYRFDPRLEIGDFVGVYYRVENLVLGNPITICRIVWDGSAFCTIKSPEFTRYNRI